MNITETENTVEKLASGLPHDQFFNDLIDKQYGRLAANGQVYLDYTGGNLYAQAQIDQHFDLLKSHVLGNPHSTNPTSKLSTELVEASRAKVLDYFKASDYFCVFTQNASASLKIIGETYPFCENSALIIGG